MSYTEDIAQSLIDTLSRTAGLPVFQLAGHVPNLAFWMSEVRHAIGVIDGYPERFANMATAQAAYDASCPDDAQRREFHEHSYQRLGVVVSPAKAENLKHQITAAAERLIKRCLKEELIDFTTADNLRAAWHP